MFNLVRQGGIHLINQPYVAPPCSSVLGLDPFSTAVHRDWHLGIPAGRILHRIHDRQSDDEPHGALHSSLFHSCHTERARQFPGLYPMCWGAIMVLVGVGAYRTIFPSLVSWVF